MVSQTKHQPESGDGIRESFLKFYASKSHEIIQSSSLIPDDPTVLLTIAGMLPFKSVFLGLKEKPAHRATSSQKCIRTNDIENVGITARHHTFFEMLGNFSFGDYFKREAIQWAWELVTRIYNLEPERIVISVYYKDEESEKIWREEIGINQNRIVKLGEKDNFWTSGSTGPCGPCSELYYDFYPERGIENIDLEDDERFIEFYNLVFMQYDRDSHGKLSDLESKNIDTGMGLERMAQILQKKKNNYETDLIFPLIKKASQLADIDYFSASEKTKTSLKILGDHTRAVVHLISDGVIASNIGRGYILRRLLRRMIRHGRLLGIQNNFICDIAEVGIKLMQDTYPSLKQNRNQILKEIDIEEIRFLKTLERGEKLLDEIFASGKRIISGSKAFELYDTYGFPLELTREIAQEKNIQIDLDGFDKEMNAQKERAKAASQNIDLSLQGSIEREIDLLPKTIFKGYQSLSNKAKIRGIFVDSSLVPSATKGERIQIVLDETSFYGEAGGQIGDTGFIVNDDIEVFVEKVIRKKEVYLHCGIVKQGEIKIGALVEARVDNFNRSRATSNHTATHLLQSALKSVVNSNVVQKGSLVAFNKLRFDFNSSIPLTNAQIFEVENLVNRWIMESHPISIKEMSKDLAIREGAVAMFGEKYDDVVRVVDIPQVSMELCGGTHAKNTSQLGCFKIINEQGISAGIRRIEALSGQALLDYFSERNLVLNQLSDLLKTKPKDLFDRVYSLQSELKDRNKEMKKMQSELAQFQYSTLDSKVQKVGQSSILISELNGLDGNTLQSAAIELTEKLGINSAVLLAGVATDSNKLLFVVSFGSNLIQSGMHAGKFINNVARICNGGGGGKPSLAQAGAKDMKKLNEALNYAKSELINQLNNYSDK